MTRLTVAQALVHALAAQYSERDGIRQRLIPGVWGIFGHGNVAGLGQALEEYGNALGLPTYRGQNEQGMVHTAVAYARHRNRLSTFACTASVGPGSTNMLTGAALATVNRLPVLLLPSDHFASRIPDPVLQGLEHPSEHDLSVNDCFRPVSRFYSRISRPEQLLAALPEALRVLTDPAETGAVVLSLPEDVQAESYDWPDAFLAERVWRVRRPPPEAELVQEVAALIHSARRPLIVAGGGVIYSGAETVLADFARRFGIPLAESQAGKGALPWNHPQNVGPIGSAGGLAANRLAQGADLILAVGTRLGDFVTASHSAFQHPGVRVVGLNVVAMDAAKLSALSLVADARAGLSALERALGDWAGTGAAYRAEITALRGEWDRAVDEARLDTGSLPPAQGAVIGAVNDSVGPHATVVCAAGSLPGDLLRLWRPEDPKAYHVEYGYSCMGYEVAAGLGVALAEPLRRVVVMVGDGSYLMMNSEIVTAVAENVNLTVVLVDNRAFMSIRGLQIECGSPSFNNELRHRDRVSGRTDGPVVQLDFVRHASGMGAQAVQVGTLAELRSALGHAAAGGVHVIVVPVNLRERVPGFESWWDVPIAAVSGQPEIQVARQEYEQKQQKQVRYFPPTTASKETK
ncbi:3D-(3,5/4)-trihydroxycyclohexane-1,2-dione acylhydrolase (decyclizing) (plasmid) [Deinococcus radiomollis]|uniref:3D-(3,5/4)-trihydroxycyclohexane-1,2-dione acylhydrolase (decyclizing) n=1 Tax=Deinococcus radiomollis TaxID=468916 RepID=UPI003892A6A4